MDAQTQIEKALERTQVVAVQIPEQIITVPMDHVVNVEDEMPKPSAPTNAKLKKEVDPLESLLSDLHNTTGTHLIFEYHKLNPLSCQLIDITYRFSKIKNGLNKVQSTLYIQPVLDAQEPGPHLGLHYRPSERFMNGLFTIYRSVDSP